MNIPIHAIVECVRADATPDVSFKKLIAAGKRASRSPVWQMLPAIDIDQDIADAQTWIKRELGRKTVTGVYLGLDTLNEKRGKGKNVEIGLTSAELGKPTEIEWIYDLKKRGSSHLIKGLYQLHRAYDAIQDEELRLIFDYVIFLGYSGIVLAAAISNLKRDNTLFVWGFHDGDILPLCRWTYKGFERLATVEEG